MTFFVPSCLRGSAVFVLLLAGCATEPENPRTACVGPAEWVRPATSRPVSLPSVMREASRAPVVLLGETHDRADHHIWQEETLAGLRALKPEMVIGVEMLPRSAQRALDRWVSGEIDEAGFLAESRWAEVWGFDFSLYRPIFQFARLNRVPMVALNVGRAAVSKVGREGWNALTEAEREGVGRPLDATPVYRDRLSRIFAEHREDAPAEEGALDRFVEAQLFWDRAMADGLAKARSGRLAVGIVGSGHLEDGHGVARQLAALGVEGTRTLLPWNVDRDCAELRPGLADAVFGIAPTAVTAPPPRLGVALERAEGAVRVRQVTQGSIAAAAGLQSGDLVLEAAGAPVASAAALSELVRRQPPGTWLPLRVRRGSSTLELVAKFPR